MTTVSREQVMPCGKSRAGDGCFAEIHESGNRVQFSVRGSAYGEAWPEPSGELHAVWYSTELYGDIPEIGSVIFRYSEDHPSTILILSKQDGAEPYFPAHASQTLYYEAIVLGPDGSPSRVLKNKDAMMLAADIDAIPPNGTRFETQEDVTFVDAEAGDPVFTLLAGSPGEVDDPGGLSIRLVDSTVEQSANQFSGEFEVTSADGRVPTRVTTFATAVGGAKLISASRVVGADFSGGARFPVQAAIDASDERRPGIIVHAFASEGPLAENLLVHMFSA
jgi:hypothetical protein